MFYLWPQTNFNLLKTIRNKERNKNILQNIKQTKLSTYNGFLFKRKQKKNKTECLSLTMIR